MSTPVVALLPPTPVWHMYRALVGIGLLCGILIVSVFEVTRPIIRQNKIEARQQAIFDVLPGVKESLTFRFTPEGTFAETSPDSEGEGLAFAGYDEQGRLVGVALEAAGMGYQDVVRVLYGYSFTSQTVIGIRVLESRETPGLGDRVETDPDWLQNFVALDVALNEDGESLRNPIEFRKNGKKQSPWQIDGISGATITSRAIADMLNESTARWIARVVRNRGEFQRED